MGTKECVQVLRRRVEHLTGRLNAAPAGKVLTYDLQERTALNTAIGLIETPPVKERIDWERMVEEVEALLGRLRQKPTAYRDLGNCPLDNPRRILGAYRRGDIDHEMAVTHLEGWKDSQL